MKSKAKKPESPKKEEGSKNREEELKETCQRLQAEFENYKKRIERDNQLHSERVLAAFFQKLLPVLDSFEEARKAKDDPGIALLQKQLLEVLQTEGLEKMESKGMFDSNLQEVMLTELSDEEEGTIIEAFQDGYYFNGKVIRHAKVKIAAKKRDSNDP